MSEVQVRPFRRPDRDQLTALVNAHIQAVVPGVSASVNTVVSQLERDPGEFIVDPWVAERMILVAEQRRRVVAAAHLLRFGAGEEVGESMRHAGEIGWLLYWPEASYWPDSMAAADALMAACLAQLRRWPVTRWYADGTLPAPGVYGLPEQGTNGTRLYGFIGDKVVGYIEVETNLAEGGRLAHLGGWADVGNLHVDKAYRRRGVATWLVGQAADWLRLARVDRLLNYAWADEEDRLALLGRVGFHELTRTTRGWVHRPGPTP
jgi:GNAT superfamily N-acetyltransferase